MSDSWKHTYRSDLLRDQAKCTGSVRLQPHEVALTLHACNHCPRPESFKHNWKWLRPCAYHFWYITQSIASTSEAQSQTAGFIVVKPICTGRGAGSFLEHWRKWDLGLSPSLDWTLVWTAGAWLRSLCSLIYAHISDGFDVDLPPRRQTCQRQCWHTPYLHCHLSAKPLMKVEKTRKRRELKPEKGLHTQTYNIYINITCIHIHIRIPISGI